MGHRPSSPMQAIRARCLDCCAGSADEVRKCVSLTCPSWPFRTGKNPWSTISESRLEAESAPPDPLHAREGSHGLAAGPSARHRPVGLVRGNPAPTGERIIINK